MLATCVAILISGGLTTKFGRYYPFLLIGWVTPLVRYPQTVCWQVKILKVRLLLPLDSGSCTLLTSTPLMRKSLATKSSPGLALVWASKTSWLLFKQNITTVLPFSLKPQVSCHSSNWQEPRWGWWVKRFYTIHWDIKLKYNLRVLSTLYNQFTSILRSNVWPLRSTSIWSDSRSPPFIHYPLINNPLWSRHTLSVLPIR